MGVAHDEAEAAWSEIWNKQNLERWLNEGLTREQIATKVAELSGRRPMSKAAVSMAMARWGIPARRARYTRTLPWVVVGDHGRAKEAILLRALGKRLAGGQPSERDSRHLALWVEDLREAGSPVIAYYADSPDGFYAVVRDKAGELDVEYIDVVTLYDGLE